MARKPATQAKDKAPAIPVPVEAPKAPESHIYRNVTPGLRMHLGDGRVVEYGESVELEGETLEAFRELGLI